MKKFKYLFSLTFIFMAFMSFGQEVPPSLHENSTSGDTMGFLSPDELPNSLLILPPPPDSGSVAFTLDVYLANQIYSHVPQARKDEAIADAAIGQPFKDIIGFAITPATTPLLYSLIIRACLYDAGGATYAAKTHYQRIRPFMYLYEYTCTPTDEPNLRGDGSYPSGHSALGWAYALLLTEIFPEKTDYLLMRGEQFGVSRNVCNAHWHSDVVAGRTVATATIARLHADPEFREALALAKKEVALMMKRKK